MSRGTATNPGAQRRSLVAGAPLANAVHRFQVDTAARGCRDAPTRTPPAAHRAAGRLLIGHAKWSLVEPAEPIAHQRQTIAVERVNPRAPLPFLTKQAGVFEHAQVTRRGRPFVFEARCDVTRARRAAAKVNGEQDLSPRRVSQRGDDHIECFELLFRVQTGSASQMVSSSSTGPIGSQTAMTSGV